MNERIWIYTLSKALNEDQMVDFKRRCQKFVEGWTAHDVSLDASFELFKNRLLIFKVNEATYNASGCSIDKQVRFIKELEQAFSIELLNRLLVAIEKDGAVEVIKAAQVKDMLSGGELDENTIIFDNTITQSSDLAAKWRLPLKATWLSKYLITS
jgi:hypothetical protein